jgi:hypothetical protein
MDFIDIYIFMLFILFYVVFFCSDVIDEFSNVTKTIKTLHERVILDPLNPNSKPIHVESATSLADIATKEEIRQFEKMEKNKKQQQKKLSNSITSSSGSEKSGKAKGVFIYSIFRFIFIYSIFRCSVFIYFSLFSY